MKGYRDLFGEVRGPALRRVGRRIHLPQSSRVLAESMRRDGAPVAKIAEALGIGESTAWKRLIAELERGMPGGRPQGRPSWSPSADDRARVERLAAGGATVKGIAEELGVSEPTLRLHCCDELARGRRLRGVASR